MSLTSYRAAPPRDNQSKPPPVCGAREDDGGGESWGAWRAWRRPTLPPLVAAVPWALRVFTAEFGMGSGVWPLAMATRPGKLPCDVRGRKEVSGSRVGLALHAGGGAHGSSRSSD